MKYLLLILPILLVGYVQAATISGEVVDSLTNQPVESATISALGFSSESEDSLYFETRTDINGKFSFENLPAGKYFLACRLPNYKPQKLPVIELAAGDVRNVLFLLQPFEGFTKPAITGYVYSTPPMLPAFIPIENAVVYLKGRQKEEKTTTHSDGSYLFKEVPPGKYLIWAEARGHQPMQTPDTIVIYDNTRLYRHNFNLIPDDVPRPVFLSGAVYDATVNTPDYPVHPAEITLSFTHPMIYGPLDSIHITITNNPDGSFLVKDLVPAIYDVRCTAKGYYTEYIKGLDLRYGPDTVYFYLKREVDPPPNYIAGHVIDALDNGTVHNATVTLASLGPTDIAYVSYSNELGFYHFKSVIPGKYEMRAIARGYYPSQIDTIIVSENTVIRDHNIYLKPLPSNQTVTLYGSVFNGLYSALHPVYPAYISLFTWNAAGDSIVFHTKNNPDGSYKIAHIPPGRYTVRCSAPGFQSQVIKDLPLEPPEVKQNFFLLPNVNPENGWMSGKVYFDESNIPVAGAVLYFISENEVLYRTKTNKMGLYRMQLPTGQYYVSCVYKRPDSSFYYQEYYDDVHSLSDATPVMVYPLEETAGINFGIPYPVPPNGVIISGRVTDDAGNPLAQALVRAIQITPPHYIRAGQDLHQVWTNDDGTYRFLINFDNHYFANVVYGFIVSAEKPGYKLEFYDEKPAPYLADILWTSEGTVFKDIDFTLDPVNIANSISGVVLGDDGNPIANTFIIAANANSGEIFFAYADRSGAYTLLSLPTGYYYVLFTAPGHLPEYYDDAFSWEDATPILAYGSVSGIDARLTPFKPTYKNGRLAGRILNLEGNPLHGALVCVRNRNGEMVDYSLTDQAGSYSIVGLENGIYQVTATKVNYQSMSDWVQYDSTVSDLSLLNLVLNNSASDISDPVSAGLIIPNDLELHPNYPNPFNPETQISFSLPKAENVRLFIYDILGRRIKELLNKQLPAGVYNVTWNGTSDNGTQVSSGIYFYILHTGDQRLARKMILSR